MLVAHLETHLRARGRRRRARGACRASRGRRKARCATRSRCSTRRSPTAPAAVVRRDACATCSASPTARRSSTCSRRRCAATCRPPSQACARNTTPAPTRRVILSDLAAFTHLVTRLKLVPGGREGSGPDRGRARPRRRVRAARCRSGALSRAWQILLKGDPGGAGRDAAASPPPRWCWCASPMPPTCRRRTRRCALLKDGAPRRRRARPSARSGAPGRPGLRPAMRRSRRRMPGRKPQLRPLAAAAAAARCRGCAASRMWSRSPASSARSRSRAPSSAMCGSCASRRAGSSSRSPRAASRDLANDLARALDDWTGRRWMVALSSEPGAPTLHEQRQAAERERKQRRRRPSARAGGAGALPRRRDRRRARRAKRGRGRSRRGAADDPEADEELRP